MKKEANLFMRCLRKISVSFLRFLFLILYVGFTVVFIQHIVDGDKLSNLLQGGGLFIAFWSIFICVTLIRLHFDRYLKTKVIDNAGLDMFILICPLPQRWIFDIAMFRGALYGSCITLVIRSKKSPYPLQQLIMNNPDFYNNVRKADKIIVLVFIGLMIISVCLLFTGFVLSKIS